MGFARRVVFDTSTLIGSLLVPDSAPRRALIAARSACELCGSEATLAELESVILRAKFNRYQNLATRRPFVALVRRQTTLFEVTESDVRHLRRTRRDPRDDKFLALALACEADLIVSSDGDLISMHPYEGSMVINATEFLAPGQGPPRKGR